MSRVRKCFSWIIGLLLLSGVSLALFRPDLRQTLAFLAGDMPDAEEFLVKPRTMTFYVEATGVLRATAVADFGAPQYFRNYWQFQLVHMVPDGKTVKAGDLLMSFEARRIQDDLQRFQNELEQATKELERTAVQIDLERQDLNAKLAAAENKHEKQKLKLEGTTANLMAAAALESDRLALEQARLEVQALQERLQWQNKSSEARLKIIGSKKSRAFNMVRDIQEGMQRFQVLSDREGVVVYRLKWNGDRYQIGETVYSGAVLVQIPDLETILADVFVPEVDIRRVRKDQSAEITIDAIPGKSWSGSVRTMDVLIRPKAWDIPNKVLKVEITLDRLDTSIMRPGMSIKARIETDKTHNVLAIPLKAIRRSGQGTFVKLKAGAEWRDQPVQIGESNGVLVDITGGLRSGDSIAAEYFAAGKELP